MALYLDIETEQEFKAYVSWGIILVRTQKTFYLIYVTGPWDNQTLHKEELLLQLELLRNHQVVAAIPEAAVAPTRATPQVGARPAPHP